MRLIRNSALGVGVVSGVVFYAFIRLVQQETPPRLAPGLILALDAGMALGICYYLFLKLTLRRVARRFREQAAALLGALPPTSADELEELHQLYERLAAALTLEHAQRASADAKVTALYQLSHDLAGDLRLEEVLQRVLGAAAALTGSQHGTVLLLDETGDRITHRIALDSGNMEPLELVAKPMMRQGLAGWVVRERRAALVQDTRQDSRWLPGPGLGDVCSAVAVPLRQNDCALGVITLAHDTAGHYAQEHLQLLEVLGAQAALAIENARLAAGQQPDLKRFDADDRTGEGSLPASRDARAWSAPEPPSAHEIVAVLAELRGFTGASERLAAEVVVREVLDIYVQAMIEAIERYEGTADTCAPDRVLAIFGYPQHRPDDASHAVGAALAMRQAAARLRTRWRARLGIDIGIGIGIASGHVVVGGIGGPERRDYRVIGDAVNLASRLQGLARAGEVLAAAEVVEAIDGADASFEIEALQPLPIKGKAVPQQIYRIAEPAAAPVARAARAVQ